MIIKGIAHGVFTRANKGMFKPFDQFIQMDEELGLNVSEDTKELLKMYDQKAREIQPQLDEISQMEEMIMILRARDNITNVTFFIIKSYIYARCTCYRSDNINQEVRTIVGTTASYGSDLKSLAKDPKFMEQTKAKLKIAVEELIKSKLKSFNKELVNV